MNPSTLLASTAALFASANIPARYALRRNDSQERDDTGAFGGKHRKRPIRFLGFKRQAQLAIWRRARRV